MKINLPTNTFPFFKFVSGVVFLISALIFPIMAVYAYMMGVVVSRAHGLGAWIAMWRAKRLTWEYLAWMTVIIIGCSLYGLKFSSLFALSFITSVLFAFHFLYDEFDLQEENISLTNTLAIASPTVLIVLFLIRDFMNFTIGSNIFIALALIITTIELLFLKEINWFFLHTKVLTLFILGSLLLSFKATSVINLFLIYHYSFWFVYPVYKLHKYKREERDNFIMILLLLILSSFYFASTLFSNNPDPLIVELAFRTFLTVTIIHILSTAPFCYLFGLKKPNYSK